MLKLPTESSVYESVAAVPSLPLVLTPCLKGSLAMMNFTSPMDHASTSIHPLQLHDLGSDVPLLEYGALFESRMSHLFGNEY